MDPVVTEPWVVRVFEKTSPSASTMNLTLPPTSMPKRLESAVAEEGLITKEEDVAFADWEFVAQVVNV